MNEEQVYAAIDALQTEIEQKKAAIAALLKNLNMQFAIRCEWTKDHTPICISHTMAGTLTYYSPRYYPGYSPAMCHTISDAKRYRSRRDAQWVLDECLMLKPHDKRRAEKLGQLWSVVIIPHERTEVK